MENIISRRRSIVPALDVSSEVEKMVKATKGIRKVGAYVVGSGPVYKNGLSKTCETIKSHVDDKPIIVKFPEIDSPNLGKSFAKTLKDAGADAVILLPYTNVEFQTEWTSIIKDQGLEVIVGGETSHCGYSRGIEVYGHAAFQGVTNFLIPSKSGKSDKVREYKDLIKKLSDKKDLTFYTQGSITEEDIPELTKAVGNHRFHLIVGNSIYWNRGKARYNSVKEMKEATLNLVQRFQ